MACGAEVSVSWAQALSWRLDRQLLAASDDAPVGDVPVAAVVRRLGAVLSMDESLAELAIAARRTSAARGDLARAVATGELIEAFAFRGSRHYLTPEEGGAFLAVRCAGRQWELPSWREFYGLAPADWPRFREAVREALTDGPLTVTELGERLAVQSAYPHLKAVFDHGAGTLVKALSWQGDVSIAPSCGGLALQRLDANPRWTRWDLDDAGRYAVAHYFSAYGPADADLIGYWLGEGLSAGARRLRGWLSDLADRLVTVDIEGQSRTLLREDVESLIAAVPLPCLRLLPGHDQWVMGPGTKETAVVPAVMRTAVTRKASLLVVDGVVRGTWAVEGHRVVVDHRDGPAPDRAQLAIEVARLAATLDRSLELAR